MPTLQWPATVPLDVSEQPQLGDAVLGISVEPVEPVDPLALLHARVRALETQTAADARQLRALEALVTASWALRFQTWLTALWVRLTRG
jgi:hypothetical protein